MGQKVNPIGFRTGVMEDWKSRWYASKQEFASLLNLLRKKTIIVVNAITDCPYQGILRFCMFPAFLCFLLCFPALFNQHYQQELPSDAPEQVLSMFCLFFVCCLSLLCFVTCSMSDGKTSQASKPGILSLNSEAA